MGGEFFVCRRSYQAPPERSRTDREPKREKESERARKFRPYLVPACVPDLAGVRDRVFVVAVKCWETRSRSRPLWVRVAYIRVLFDGCNRQHGASSDHARCPVDYCWRLLVPTTRKTSGAIYPRATALQQVCAYETKKLYVQP